VALAAAIFVELPLHKSLSADPLTARAILEDMECINFKAETPAKRHLEAGWLEIGMEQQNKCHKNAWMMGLNSCPLLRKPTTCAFQVKAHAITDIASYLPSRILSKSMEC